MRRFLFAGTIFILSSLTLLFGAEYPMKMAPIEEYMMASVEDEIRLALSAGPPKVTRDANVLVFTPRGYETLRKGNNGFTCLVERS